MCEILIDQGADIYKENHIPERAIQVASNLEIVKLLVDQGEDINDINDETHALLIGTESEGIPKVSKHEYFEGKNRRFGVSNPEKVNVKLWLEMIKSGASAWQARSLYSDETWDVGEPGWCYQRFGENYDDFR